MASPECNMQLQTAWVRGLARHVERRWCLLSPFMLVFKMYCMSAVLFVTANVGIPYTPRMWWANAWLTKCALYFRRPSFATWASISAWKVHLYSLNVLTGIKPTSPVLNFINYLPTYLLFWSTHHVCIEVLELIICHLHPGVPHLLAF